MNGKILITLTRSEYLSATALKNVSNRHLFKGHLSASIFPSNFRPKKRVLMAVHVKPQIPLINIINCPMNQRISAVSYSCLKE